jgi:selenide,water dikinase
MDISVLREIIAGGLDKMREVGVVLVGGHSVEDKELKYGLSVTGVIHPERVVQNTGAVVGDKLILTKPLGLGIINTAVKSNMVDGETATRAIAIMAALNKTASEVMMEVGVHAATDVTGFGLLGHGCEMISDTEVGMVIHSWAVPYLPQAKGFAEMGLLPGGLYRNRDFRAPMVEVDEAVPRYLADIFFDPQTSGGLLISVSADKAPELLSRLREKGVGEAAVIGEIVSQPKGKIIVK